MTAPTMAQAAELLASSTDYKVLRRYVRRREYGTPADARARGVDDLKVGLYVDVETTGLDTTSDKIIQLALVPFEFDHAGRVYAVGFGMRFYNDPGMPIPREVKALTGITDAHVRGQSIDEVLVLTALDDAALVIAHNAEFDRRMIERHIAAFAGKPWACSFREVEWARFGCVGAKLQHILADTCGEFYDAHEALEDCHVGVHVLASATLEGRTALSYLLESARQPTLRIWAIGAPFAVKDALKRRGYRWCDGSEGRTKAWYRDVRQADYMVERDWLYRTAFVDSPLVQTFDAVDRYSTRMGA